MEVLARRTEAFDGTEEGRECPYPTWSRVILKGQCHEIFCFCFFHESIFPQPQSIPFRPFFEFFRKFAEIFASQGAPPVSMTPVANLPPVSTTPAAKLPPVSMTPVANLPPVSTTWWQIFPPFSLALLIPVANLPPVSTIPAANLPPVSTTPVANCHRYQRRRWQIMATISGCRHLKVNLKAKIYIYVNSTTQRCSNKIIKIFLLEGFFHLPPVANLELRISPRIFEKIWNGPNSIIRGLGETDSRKKPEAKNLVILSL